MPWAHAVRDKQAGIDQPASRYVNGLVAIGNPHRVWFDTKPANLHSRCSSGSSRFLRTIGQPGQLE